MYFSIFKRIDSRDMDGQSLIPDKTVKARLTQKSPIKTHKSTYE